MSRPTSARRSRERTVLPLPLLAGDAVLLGLVTAIALSPLAEAYAGSRWVVAAVLGIAVAAAATLLARALRFGPLLTGLLLAVLYLLVGPAAAAPDKALLGVLPSLDAERLLVTGIVESWRSALTLPVPLGGTRGELVVPFAIALVGGMAATTLLWRSRWPSAAGLAVVAMFAAAAAFGIREDGFPVLRAATLVVLLLAWIRWRALRAVRTSWLRRTALGVAVAAVAGVAGWGAAAVAGTDRREVLRDHVVPPMAALDFKSPLARYRDYYKNHKADVLFTLTGLPAGEPLVRLATMDSYDGLVWNVVTTDVTTGSSAFRPAPASASGSAVEVTVGAYDGPWIPTVGAATGATLVEDAAPSSERELLINTATGSLAEHGNVREGDVFRIDWSPRQDRTNELLVAAVDRSFTVPPMEFPAIEKLDALAQRFVSEAGAGSDFERAVALEKGFREEGFFNDGLDPKAFGASASGHGAKRLADLVADEKRMVGNDEQYASAMAYAAQRLGLPARVVLGFEKTGASGSVTGDDIAAWVEIPFVDHGWVPFDPTPPEEQTPPPLKDSPDPVPQPYVVQPPVLPQEPAEIQGVPPEGAGRDLSDRIWDIVLLVLRALWLVVKALLLLSPLWLLLLVKAMRRRRRRTAADPLDRISGGWREFADHARDLGARIPAGHTRHETSLVLAGRFPQTPATPLAAAADAHVFGPGEPTAEQVQAYWADIDSALARMRAEVPWWRRLAGWFSPASIPWRQAGGALRSRGAALAHRVRSFRKP